MQNKDTKERSSEGVRLRSSIPNTQNKQQIGTEKANAPKAFAFSLDWHQSNPLFKRKTNLTIIYYIYVRIH